MPSQRSLKPDTTFQQDQTTAGQRRINIIWEVTQAILAVLITAAVVYNETKGQSSTVLTNAFFLVVSMYLVRTNHQKVGGVGAGDVGR